jgi:5'-deoxynucleotidase YfbR-like HD superfamily hydrolase
MQEILSVKEFELIDDNHFRRESGHHVAEIGLTLGKAAMDFSRVERVPRYASGERESDAEHSFMLALVAPELAVALELPLDIGLVSQYATVHDLIELKTNDVATFLFSEDDQLQKELDEQAALRELLSELPPHTGMMVARYESQREPEARFVRYVDKLLPVVVDILGPGKKVMREDYGVTNRAMLEQCHNELHERLVKKFGGEFPEIDMAHEVLCNLFLTQFSEAH